MVNEILVSHFFIFSMFLIVIIEPSLEKYHKRKRPMKEETKTEDQEKIFFGEKMKICFACGEKFDDNTETCPYCGTKQK